MGHEIIFDAEVWLHSHAETGDPCEYEVFNVSGEKIPTHLIEHMIGCNTEWEWLARAGVPMETVVHVKAKACFESESDYDTGAHDAWWELACLEWVEEEGVKPV